MSQKVGLSLIGVGVLVLIGWSVEGFFFTSEIPVIVRISVGVIAVGLLVLIWSVVADRIAAAKTEDFKEVKP
ncbi:MAG: hypothetical protein OEX97_06340 [Acidimicrobiia bacterium]|nr:hypothetical protein [Acidimicrobiia bacterium]